jgi:hypothetical protein
MFLPKGLSGKPCACPEPTPQLPEQQATTFWDFIQKASLLFGLAATVRSFID